MKSDNKIGYKYTDPSYEEVAHKGDPFCSVEPNRYESFLRGFHYGMETAEAFLREQFEMEETVIHEVLDRYREHMIEFTWMDLREDPEWTCLEMYDAGVFEGKLLPPMKETKWSDIVEDYFRISSLRNSHKESKKDKRD